MAYLSDSILDAALQYIIDNCDALYICSTLPSTYAEATSTYALGSKSSPSLAAITNGTSGRKTVLSAITDGSVSATGSAGFYALVDTVGTELLLAQSFTVAQNVTSGNQFTTDALNIQIPDVA